MASTLDRLEHVHPEDRAAWRAWLAANHATADGAWLVSWKAATGRPRLPYADTVEEALCVGWVDSRAGTIDHERSRLLFTPRRAGSGWSRPNKERIERLAAAGLLLPAGIAVVEAARVDGSWFALDDVENLVEPPELADALDADQRARGHWDAFPRSASGPSSRGSARPSGRRRSRSGLPRPRGWRPRTSARTSGGRRAEPQDPGGASGVGYSAPHHSQWVAGSPPTACVGWGCACGGGVGRSAGS